MDGSPIQKKPSNIEAEQQLLGALLLDGERLDSLNASTELFFDPVHAELFQAIKQRRNRGELVSPVAMRVWAEGYEPLKDLGGPGYLARLAGAAISPSQIKHYADMLADLSIKRKLLSAMDEARTALMEDEEGAAIISARLEASLMGLEHTRDKAAPVSMLKATTDAVESSVAAHKGDDRGGVDTGILALDRILSKMQPGELIVLGGRPSMGKTAIAMSIAMHQARMGRGVCFASAEMMPEALAKRAISEETARSKSAVSYKAIESGEYTEDQGRSMVEAAKNISESPVFILPPNARDLGSIFAGVRRSKALLGEKVGLRLIVVDYLQLLNASGRSRNEEIGMITGALKGLAAEMKCPILALSQLSRQVESRDNKRPMMSDLRDSGSVEQDADAVLFAYRDEYYLERIEPDEMGEKYDAWEGALERSRNRAEIIVAKQRKGPIGTAHIRMNPALNLIWDEAG